MNSTHCEIYVFREILFVCHLLIYWFYCLFAFLSGYEGVFSFRQMYYLRRDWIDVQIVSSVKIAGSRNKKNIGSRSLEEKNQTSFFYLRPQIVTHIFRAETRQKWFDHSKAYFQQFVTELYCCIASGKK